MGTLNDVFGEGRVVVAKTGNLMTNRHDYTGKLINLCKLVVFSPIKKKETERRIMIMPVGCCKGLNKIIYIRHLKHLASLNGSHAIFD